MMIYKHNSVLHYVLSLAELLTCKQNADVSVYKVWWFFFFFAYGKTSLKYGKSMQLSGIALNSERAAQLKPITICSVAFFYSSALTNCCPVVEGTPAVL